MPLMEHQLEQNASSHAFDEFDVNWNDQVDNVQCLYNFTLPKVVQSKFQSPLSCTDLSWNSNGRLIAASFGRFNVTGWCLESGYIAVYEISNDFQNDLKVGEKSITKTPTHVIHIEESYAMRVAFHPKMESVVAIGTYDGGVRIHKLEAETDSLIAASSIEQYSHKDPILSLQWLKNRIDNSYVLVSMSSDGVILWWTARNRLAIPIARYKLLDLEKGSSLGISSLSFLNKYAGSSLQNKIAPTTDNSFIVGTEVGQIFKTSFTQIERVNLIRGWYGIDISGLSKTSRIYNDVEGIVTSVLCVG
ncbi:hypothetical protein AKO1_013099 [Acrasis kona]|uniref:Uncharacterized protein n=1 Tax=Acrasis kona TaxID=1008807 RepID=A0AAW2ZDH4_9EUKA